MIEERGSLDLEPRFFARMTEADLRTLAEDEEDLEFLRSLGVRSAVTVALRARGQVKGTMTLAVAWSGRRYRTDHAEFARILSGRVALALDNAGLFTDLERAERARAEIGETLQRGLLPPALPHIPGWSMAAMYRPAGAENEVGGDFYDAFRLPGGWMLVIGDVTGRGARAASITAVVRYTIRTAVSLTSDPRRALTTLNRALLARGDAALCTLVALILDEDPARPAQMTVAGHPLPLRIDGEDVVEAGRTGPVVGAFEDASWDISEIELEHGEHLVVVTDGVTEAEGRHDRFGEERLRATVAGVRDPGQVIQRLEERLTAFTGGDLDDDVAVLAIARRAIDSAARQLGSGRMERLPGLAGADG